MPKPQGSQHGPRSEAHAQLGEELRRLRQERGLTLRELAGDRFSDGHLSNVENGRTTPSTQLLEHYVAECGGNYALLELLLNQVSSYSEQRRRERRAAVRDEPIAPTGDDDIYSLPEPLRLYRLSSIESRVTYDGHGIPTELRAIISLRAKVPNLNRYYFGIGCQGDYRRGVIELESSFGCSLGEFRESDKGVHDGYFLLDKKLHPNDPEPHTFSFRAVYHTHNRAIQPIVSQPKTETARYVVSVQFTPPSRPEKIWWFDVATAVEIEDDQPTSQTFPPDPSDYYHKEFMNLAIGRIYGLNWQWE